jgi:hypothetical protein
MSYFVVVPGALIPASIAPPLLARAKLPLLMRWLTHARMETLQRLAGDGAAHLDWLWTKFGGIGQPVTAPYAWRALNRASAIEVPSELPLWQADPVHFAFARDHMLVTALDAKDEFTADESRALATDAAALVTGFDATLRVLDASHWFLSFDPPWPLKAVAYDAALGQSAERVLPSGEAAGRWRKLLTEIQISWHQHPVNERRENDGKRTINGVWLHGGGSWQALPKRPFDAVATRDATICGWALASGLPPNALLDDGTKPARVPAALVYWPDLCRRAGQEDWDGWLEVLTRFDTEVAGHVEHAFASGFGEVTLVLAGREAVRCVVLRESDRLRFWRNNALTKIFGEDEPA